MIVCTAASSRAQDQPTLPSKHFDSPEWRAQLETAASNSALEPWKREFMRGLVELPAAGECGSAERGAAAAMDANGEWQQLPPPIPRTGHTAIYDPVRDRIVVSEGTTVPTATTSTCWTGRRSSPSILRARRCRLASNLRHRVRTPLGVA
jgi:hypothetical protein